MNKSTYDFALMIIEHLLKGIPYVIAGGFPRDLFFNVEPNDIDVWIKFEDRKEDTSFIPKNNVLDVVQILNDNAQAFTLHGLANNRIDCNYTSNGDVDIHSVIKWGNIDLIFVNRDLDRVTEMFDYNLNQFILDEGSPKFVGENLGELIQLKESIPNARMDKMETMFSVLVDNPFWNTAIKPLTQVEDTVKITHQINEGDSYKM